MPVAPVALPPMDMVNAVMFEPLYHEAAGEGGGLGQTAEIYDPQWVCEYRFEGFPNRAAQSLWRTFLDRYRLRKFPVLLFDPRRRVPLTFYGADGKPASGSPWGSPTLASHSRADSTLTLAAGVPGMEWSEGDYIGFQETGGRYNLHRLTAPATVGGGGVVTVEVTPRPARSLTYSSPALILRDAPFTGVLSYDLSGLEYSSSGGAPLRLRAEERRRSFI